MKLNKDICKRCNIEDTVFWDENGWTEADEKIWRERDEVYCPASKAIMDITKGMPAECKYALEQTVMTQKTK